MNQPVKIILGKPVQSNYDHEDQTLDLGPPEKRVTRDGRIVEVPSADYLRRLSVENEQ